MDFLPHDSPENLPECFCESEKYTTGLSEASVVVRAFRNARLKRHQQLYEDKFAHDLYKIGFNPYSRAPFYEVHTAEVVKPAFDHTDEEKELLVRAFVQYMEESIDRSRP